MKSRNTPILSSIARLALAGLAISSCAAGDDAPGSSAAGSSMARIHALIGGAACESDAQCRTVAVGAKACGGPQSYLAWSTAKTEPEALMSEVMRLQLEEKREAVRSGLASTCSIVRDPGAYCGPQKESASNTGTAGKHLSCQLRQTGGAAGNLAR